MRRTAVLNLVGLTESLLGPRMPRLARFRAQGALSRIVPALPALTCTAQSNYLTGQTASVHGVVANGWYNRELAEVQFWKQSNHLVTAPKVWESLRAKAPGFTVAKLFWWYNMYSSADWSVTPRPMYPADGRKLFDIYAWPYGVRDELKRELGEFPFAGFWGPAAGLDSPQGPADGATRWIAAAARIIEQRHQPTLNLVYLPHLDYNLQRLGPGDPRIDRDLRQADDIAGGLIDFFQSRGVRVLVLSEYGITPVKRPVHLNRRFREQRWITVKQELGLELLDCGNSKAFAVADHQVAHVYINDRSIEGKVRALLEQTEGVAQVLGAAEKRAAGLDHPRAGDLVAIAEEDAWFTYYYWQDDALAPDFARCVDIHRKPGYDPAELFLDPAIPLVKLKILRRLLQKKLGFRMLMDVIPLDASLVQGSHGCRPRNPADWPVLLAEDAAALPQPQLDSTEVFEVIGRRILA